MTRDSVRISIRDSSGVKDTAFATGGAITVPHVSMMYSVIELEIAAALSPRQRRPHRAGRQHPVPPVLSGPRHRPELRAAPADGCIPLGGGKVELWHDWLSGIGDVTVDSSRRMLTYSGARSTYKVA